MAPRVSVWLSVLVFALISSSISADDDSAAAESKEFVLTLDHTNFTDVIAKHDFIVVEFYAPWCGHCKKLAPEFEKAASVLSSHDPPVVLAKVDASTDTNRELGSQYEIKGFPTLKILRKGGNKVEDYKGPREADGIVDYLKKQSGPASAEIKSAEDADSIIDEKKIIIVGVFSEFAGEEFENYTLIAEKFRSDYDFGHTVDIKLLPRGEASAAGPLIRLLKPFDELFIDYKNFDLVALEKFIEEASVPVVTVFNTDPSNHPFVGKFFNSANAKAMLFMNFTTEVADAMKTKYREVAEQYKGDGLSFLLGDVEAGQGAFQYFGLKAEQVPLIIIQNTDGQKYLKSNVEPDQIAAWFKDYKDGNVSPFKKSEQIPETNDEPVKVVVADTLHELVLNSGKNVLIEFYAPWCGHCKKLAPILDEVAASYENDPDVLIAKLDATANDISSDLFDVQGYPTLYFRTASGNLMLFDDDRTKEGIMDYIEKNRDKAGAAQEETPKEESVIKEIVTEKTGKDEL